MDSLLLHRVTEEETCTVYSRVDLWDFLLKKQFFEDIGWRCNYLHLSSVRSFPVIDWQNQAKFAIHVKGGFRVTASKRMFTILLFLGRLLYMWRLTVKHALILVNNDMIFNSFSCKVQQQKIDEESSVEFGIYQ